MERLALEGGNPVRSRLLPYGLHSVDEEDVQAVAETLRSSWLTTGPRVAEFEAAFARRVRAAHAVAVSSGTAALHAAAFAAGLGPGDEVVTTPMTFAATANCVRYMGGTVVFADVQRDTLNLDPAAVAAKIGPRTRAVVAVDYSGQPADLDDFRALAANRGLLLIEDAAHAVGATYKGEVVGTQAALTTFSFHPVKHVTTAEGGLVTTQDPELAARARRFRNHGITTDARERQERGDWLYEMVDLGYNYRLPDVQCTLGISQLGKLEGFLARRRAIAARYTAELGRIDEVECPTVRPDRESAWHVYVIRLRLDRLRADRTQVFRALRAENIGVNVHYIPVHFHPYYRALGHRPGECPVAEGEYERMITIPLYPGMTDGDVTDVVEAVRKVVGHYRR